jgi:hypothetical protein
MRVFVLNMRGQPLMPTTPGKARILLKENKARVVQRKPFTIQLKYVTGEAKQDIKLGIDPGVKTVGVCAKSDKEILFAAEIELRTLKVAKNMQTRAMYRHLRRSHRRDKRKRRAKKSNTIFSEKEYRFTNYDKSVIVKLIKPSLCRFLNRKRSEGWFTPTANHLLESHKQIVRKIKKVLPISEVVLEYCGFDIHKLKNPEVNRVGYQNGEMKGSTNFTSYILTRDGHTCRKCKKRKGVKLQVHHIIRRLSGGTDVPSNGLTLCEKCHFWTHKNEKNYKWIQKKFGSLDNKFFQPTSLLNTIIPAFTKWLYEEFNQAVSLTFGYENKDKRRLWNLDKEHWIDAFCCVSNEIFDLLNVTILHVKQFRRHCRANISTNRDRNYRLDGKTVATNRNSRLGQNKPSIKEFSEKCISRMIPIKGKSLYRSNLNVVSGSTVFTNLGVKVVKGTSDYGRMINFTDTKKYMWINKLDFKVLLKPYGMVYI